MDFRGVVQDTAKQMQEVVDFILSLDISPESKMVRLQNAFHVVGSEFYSQLFSAVSEVFDSTAIASLGLQMADDQIYSLSLKLVRNYGLGRETSSIVTDFYDSVLGNAQNEAFRNAVSLEKHPTLTRRLVSGATKPKNCRWCEKRAGTYIDPEPEDFTRHAHCDCMFIVKGFNSRNGLLTNYKKGK